MALQTHTKNTNNNGIEQAQNSQTSLIEQIYYALADLHGILKEQRKNNDEMGEYLKTLKN
ncbi:MAG: hypothetical protein ACTSWL_01170 [Promethearchaeota archaeon]